jgi:hypothetical protein
MNKIDLFKTGIVLLLIALVYFMFKLSKTIESNAVEYAKTGRFTNMGDYVILDTQTGATYDVSDNGAAPIRTPVITK